MKYELQNVISGKGEVIHVNSIQAVASYLKGSTGASKLVKESEFFRKQETEILIEYITANDKTESMSKANFTHKKQVNLALLLFKQNLFIFVCITQRIKN